MSGNMTMKEKMWSGIPLDDVLIIDAHTHVGSGGNSGIAASRHQGRPQDVLDHLDTIGIDLIVTFSWWLNSDIRLGNDEVARWMHDYPNRIVAFTGLNPNAGPEAMVAELERCWEMGLRGIKLIPQLQGSHPYPIDGPYFRPVYEFANQQKMAILSHSWDSPTVLAKLARTYPLITFIVGHFSGGVYGFLTREFENVYQSTTTGVFYQDVARFVKEYGAEKLVYGSDLAAADGAWGVAQVVFARIGDEEKRKILGLNMASLLNRSGLLPESLSSWII
jgi:predicted TIM-barrel fold metal-dependent hydrolase